MSTHESPTHFYQGREAGGVRMEYKWLKLYLGKTYSSSAGFVDHGQFAQILWYLFLVCFIHRLHVLQISVSGVTSGG